MTDAYMTLENQWRCVTLAAVENMLIRLCSIVTFLSYNSLGSRMVSFVSISFSLKTEFL